MDSFRPGLSTLNISRTPSTGDGKNITPKRLTTASKVSAGNGRRAGEANSNCAFLNPKMSFAPPRAATHPGPGRDPQTISFEPPKRTIDKNGSPGPRQI